MNKYKFIQLFKSYSYKILILFAILEVVLFFNLPVILGALYSLIGWFLICRFVIRPEILFKHPLPGLVVLGFGICSFYLPIPTTLLDLNPMTNRMEVPLSVFALNMLALCTVVSSLVFYSTINKKQEHKGFFRKMFYRVGLYDIPSDLQIWMMGIIGVLSILYSHLSGNNVSETVSSSDKFIEGFFPLAYLPYYFFLRSIYTTKSDTNFSKRYKIVFYIYTAIIIFLALLTNHRATFMKVLMGMGFTYFLGLLLNKFSYKIFSTQKILLFALVAILITGPLSKLGTAMVTVRKFKKEVTATQLMEATLDTYGNESALNATRRILEGTVVNNIYWDEHYVDNLFLSRLSNLKAADLSVYHYNRLSDFESAELRNFLLDQVLSLLPSPVIVIFNLDVDKAFVSKASFGDYLYYLSTNDHYGLESKRQAQLSGAGMAAFGYAFLPILFITMIVFFSLLDLLTFWKDNIILFSMPALMQITKFFTYFNHEGISTFLLYIGRGWIQSILLYLIVYHFTKPITRIASKLFR